MTTEMKLPSPIQFQNPGIGATAIELHKYYAQFSPRYHLENCPIHMELFGD
jgi:hypothetical protein